MSAIHDKLNRWADQLLDTGKRNNLISFKDTKTSTAEVLLPNPESVFSKCAVGHTFRIFDPKIIDESTEDVDVAIPDATTNENGRISRERFFDLYSARVRGSQSLLVYALTPNPLTAVRSIAKRARQMQEETGINATYLAFGFIRWNEREGARTYYRAPLLLVHVNVTTGSIIDPVKIEVTDDDVIVNPTFSFLLQAERGLKLPEYEEDDTLPSYYNKVAVMIRALGWEIQNECKLGIFSFLKINMYEDLKSNTDLILENSNIRAILGEQKDDAIPNPSHMHVVANPLVDLHTVVGADSSQLEAIEMTKAGRSFVLQGPPGTGKSQTITNVIAECLYDGKKVLFVSEKLAALNVVYDKLAKAGLSDFCLELHSHKANKKAVIDELNRTLRRPKIKVSSTAAEDIRQKRNAQARLDSYAAVLHERREVIEKSFYQLIELHSLYRSYPDTTYVLANIGEKGNEWLLHARELLERYVEYVPTIGRDYRENPWFGFNDLDIDYDQRNQLRIDLETLVHGYKTLANKMLEIEARYGASVLNFAETVRWQSLLNFLAATDVITPALFSLEHLVSTLSHLQKMRYISSQFISARDELFKEYTPETLEDIDGKSVHNLLSTQLNSFFSRLFNSEYKSIVTSIQSHSKNGSKPNYQQALAFSTSLSHIQELKAAFEEEAGWVKGTLGLAYHGIESDWDYLTTQIKLLQPYLDNSIPLGSFQGMTQGDFVANQPKFLEDYKALEKTIGDTSDARARVSHQFDSSSLRLETDSYDSCIQKLESCLSDFDRIGNWIAFQRLLNELHDARIDNYISTIILDGTDPKDVVGSFCKLFYRQWAERVMFSVPELATFSRIVQDQSVKAFADKDALQYEISKAQIKSKLSEQRPNLNLVAGGSAVATLQREGQKKRRQLPIRKLLAEIGDLVQVLKPCFLMSPLSVSTYLDPSIISFDTVVFDEASQIFPQDAIGAIYRGKQLIVVGDSKQMPPSNFFSSSVEAGDADDEMEDATDFESILDVCSSVFTTQRLAWHYRSKYEQLIAFSNIHFYDNGLVTFPSPVTDREGVGVDYCHVNGVFDRKSKTNRREAECVVDRVFDHFKNFPERSLGVIAFSVAQQTLIDRLISRRREEDPSFEPLFSSDRNEPFFVKNLETVQGDERDTIIFSIAYAPDADGRFLHNFGPLNRMGGERRLNVAVTRAKVNVQLVASIHSTDIDLSRTGSKGARLLRSYLDFAQNGEKALGRTPAVGDEDPISSSFETEVCDFLKSNGYSVDTQVGCSGYRINIALKRPHSSDYFYAIECDGAIYQRSKNARDRDCLRQNVLEGMGWTFYRIWSTEWFKNTAIEQEKVLAAVTEATSEAERKELASSARPNTVMATDSVLNSDAYSTELDNQQSGFSEYRETDALGTIRSARAFQLGVLRILQAEAPLSEEYLLKRICQYFGREKLTKVVVREFSHKMIGCEERGIVRRDGFLYLNDTHSIKMRIPGDRRDIKYIALEELADGLSTIIRQNVVVTKPNLYKTLSSVLGYKRTSNTIIARFDQALKLLMTQGKVTERDGLLRCLDLAPRPHFEVSHLDTA